jgi:hypothetical protein
MNACNQGQGMRVDMGSKIILEMKQTLTKCERVNPNILKWFSHFESWNFVKSQIWGGGGGVQIINTIQIESQIYY